MRIVIISPLEREMIRSAMNPQVFLELVESSRCQLTDKEYAKITARMEDVIATSKHLQSEQWEAKRLFRSGRGLANGFAPQSTKRLKNLLLYVLKQMGEFFQTKMNKVLFYIDFLSYRERGIAISGLTYNALEFGPVPQRWDRVYSAFYEVGEKLCLVQEQECMALMAGEEADMSDFSTEEINIINTVCEKMKKMTSRAVSKMSHKEPAWKDHASKQEAIPFIEAFSLVGM